MITLEKLKHEFLSMIAITAFFIAWVGMFIIFKKLFLAEYNVNLNIQPRLLIGILVLAKVVLVLEHVPMGSWALVRTRPAWVYVLLRTALFTIGIFVVLLLERSFDHRHEFGGMFPAMSALFREGNLHRILANTLVISCALFFYNALFVVRHYLGGRGFLQLFMLPPPNEIK